MTAMTTGRRTVRLDHIRALVLVGVLAALMLALVGCGGSNTDALEVNDLAADPLAYSGDIAVTGIVQEINAAESRIVLIDQIEYETCGLFPCAGAGLLPLHLPLDGTSTSAGAQYEGALPQLEQLVIVHGRITGAAGDTEFDVDRIELSGKTILEKK